MGVNFPAHLVIIKSTSQYVAGCYKDYSDTQMLQMIGRAGRPQVINIINNTSDDKDFFKCRTNHIYYCHY